MIDKQLSKAQLYDLLIKHLEITRPETLSDFYNTLSHGHEEVHNIPADIFVRELTPLEAITKYLKENQGLTLKQIGDSLNRNQRNIWHTYNNSKHKHPNQLHIPQTPFLIPLTIFRTSQLSIPESLITYLKDFENLTNTKIARLLNRNPRTIWTTYYRAKKKLFKS